jgi:hypothetical protein
VAFRLVKLGFGEGVGADPVSHPPFVVHRAPHPLGVTEVHGQEDDFQPRRSEQVPVRAPEEKIGHVMTPRSGFENGVGAEAAGNDGDRFQVKQFEDGLHAGRAFGGQRPMSLRWVGSPSFP